MKDFEGAKEIGFYALFNGAAIGILVTDEESRILQANPFLLQMFGYSHAELIGKSLELLMPTRFKERHIKHRTDYQDHPRSRIKGTGFELFARCKDGAEFPVEVSLGPYSSAGENYVIAFVNDISHSKVEEEDLKRLNAELEGKVAERTFSLKKTVQQLEQQMKEVEAKDRELHIALNRERELNELKSRFVSLASHEFRTPLSAILSSTFLVSKYAKSADLVQQERHLKKISACVNMLTDMLNDFLSVGKIEEGKVEARYVVFDLYKYLNNIVDEMNCIVKRQQVLKYTHDGDHNVELDPSLLRHIITNLLSNAIKFSPEESPIVMHTSCCENGTLTMKVKDQGMGIPLEDQPHLFERFFRGTNVSYIQGTGLGLHIIGKYVDLMEGSIICESELGKGTVFTITFRHKKSVPFAECN